MRPNYAVEALGSGVRSPGEGTERISLRHTLLLSQLPARFHHHQTGEPRPPLPRDYACKCFGTPPAACRDPPVATIDLDIVAQHHGLIEGMRSPEPREEICTIAVQAGLIFLEAQHVVSALLRNLPRDFYLTSHRIDGHYGASQIEHA